MNAAIYLRISSDRSGEGLGVQRQEDICRDLAADKGADIIEVIPDNDTSAYGTRPGFDRLLSLAANGTIDTIITYAGDRLARRPRDLERLLDLVEGGRLPGGIVTKLAGDVDISTPSGRSFARIIVAIAHSETEIKVERLKAKNIQHAKAGGVHGGRRPLGFADDRRSVHPVEGPLLRDAAKRIISGDSLRAVCSDWTAPPSGKSISNDGAHRGIQPGTLRRSLLSPRMVGERHFSNADGVEMVVPNTYAAILDRDTWDRCRAVLTAQGRRRTTATGLRRWLAGVAVCHSCERSLTGSVSHGTRFYTCANRDCDQRVSISCDNIEDHIEPMLVAVLADPRLLDRMVDVDRAGDVEVLDAEIDVLEIRLADLEAEAVAGRIDASAMGRMSAAISEQRSVLVADRDGLLVSDSMKGIPRGTWTEMNPRERRDLASAVFDRIVVFPAPKAGRWSKAEDRVEVVWRS